MRGDVTKKGTRKSVSEHTQEVPAGGKRRDDIPEVLAHRTRFLDTANLEEASGRKAQYHRQLIFHTVPQKGN